MAIIEEIRNHFDRQFKTLNGSVAKSNDSAWAYNDQNLKGVRQWMYHILETIEYYTSNMDSKEFHWGAKFGGDWEDPNTLGSLTPALMQAYLSDVEMNVSTILANLGDESLLQPEKLRPWTGKTVLGKMLYLMRHNQQHIGDINRILRVCGCEPLDWH